MLKSSIYIIICTNVIYSEIVQSRILNIFTDRPYRAARSNSLTVVLRFHVTIFLRSSNQSTFFSPSRQFPIITRNSSSVNQDLNWKQTLTLCSTYRQCRIKMTLYSPENTGSLMQT